MTGARVAKAGVVYFVRPSTDPVFFTGMGAEAVLKYDNGDEKVAGIFGVVHPEVLENYEVQYPCSVTELDIDLLM